jgi:phosphatidylglycerophosphate synthase
MSVAAVIVVPGGGGLSPLTQFGGLSLLKRAVLTAQKAGVKKCYLCCGQDLEDLQRELQDDARVTNPPVWLRLDHLDLQALSQESMCLVFAVDTIFRHPFVQQLLQQAAIGETLVVTDPLGNRVLALVPGTHITGIVQELAQGKALHETAVLVGGHAVPLNSTPHHFVCNVTPETSFAHAEQELLLSLENPRDGLVDTYVNRKLSRPITRHFLRTSLSPNHITIFSCLIGVLGALCFFPGGYWGPLLGALLLQFSVVLDCCDGEVARIKFMESPLGDWLDIVCDTVVHIAIFLGIGIAVWHDGASSHALMLGSVLALGGVLAFPLVTLAEKTEEAGERRNGWEDVLIKKLLASLTTRDFSVLILASALSGRLVWFLWGAAVGAHVFWLSLAWLLFRTGRFSWARRGWERKET